MMEVRVMKDKILLIIPAYNEEKNILEVYNSILKYNKQKKKKYDVLVINDGSNDNTNKVLNEKNIPHIDLIFNLGIGGAVQAGYKYAYENNYDIAVQFDGDGQHDVRYIENITNPIIEKKADMVIGSRFIDKTESEFQSSSVRRLGIQIISKVIKLKTSIKIYDTTSGFRAIDKKIISLFANDYPQEYPEPISTVEVINNGCKIKEVSVSMNERQGGVSSITSWKTIYYMVNVILTILLSKKKVK